MSWSVKDPRDLTSKRASIVVWAPPGKVFRGQVETHQGWSVILERTGDERKLISESDEWPSEWAWIPAPQYDELLKLARIKTALRHAGLK